MNFFIAGDLTAVRAGQGQKSVHSDIVSSESSFQEVMSDTLITLGLAPGSINHSELTENLVMDTDKEKALMAIFAEIDEILTMQLTLINSIQEVEDTQLSLPIEGKLKEELYYMLEEVLGFMSLLQNVETQGQKASAELLADFPKLSEKVMTFLKLFLGEKVENEPAPLIKEKANLKELMNLIESKLSKLEIVDHAGNSSRVASNLFDKGAAPLPDTFFQTGPVSMNFLQLPKQSTIQWVIDTTSSEAAKEQLMQKLEGILAKSSTRLINGNQSMTIRLAPEHLGTLHIKVQETQQGLVTKLIVHSKAAATLLESGLASLKQTLTQANVNMDKLEVVFQDQEQKFTQQQKGSSEEHSQSKHSPRQGKDQEVSQQSFEEVLLEELEIMNPVGEKE